MVTTADVAVEAAVVAAAAVVSFASVVTVAATVGVLRAGAAQPRCATQRVSVSETHQRICLNKEGMERSHHL